MAYGICPVHPPETPEQMRRIVKSFADEAYKMGVYDTKRAVEEFMESKLTGE